jgi:hypothetical protein
MPKRLPRFDSGRILDAVPVRNARVRILPGETAETIIVEVELRYRGWRALPARWLKPRRSRRYALETLGREVYEAIDGVRTFEQLTEDFAARHRLTFQEARGLLWQYCRTLIARGLVAVALPGEQGQDGG